MSKGKIAFTDGTYTFDETGIRNQFYFYRNDRKAIGKMGSNDIMIFYSQYLLHKVEEGELPEEYAGEISVEISTDGKCIRMVTIDKQFSKPKLHIIKMPEDISGASEDLP